MKRCWTTGICLVAASVGPGFARVAVAVPVVPGMQVTTYANVPDPVRISFAPDGTLYVGRDNQGSGGTGKDAVKIHRVSPGGATVVEYGAGAIEDPDAVVFDATGTISGTPGSVLVAGTNSNNEGVIAAILPDQTLQTLFVDANFPNPTDFRFDSTGRLIFTEFDNNQVYTTTGGTPVALFSTPDSALNITTDTSDNIFVGTFDGTIRKHNSDGTVADAGFVTGLGSYVSLDFALGGVFGTDLYAFSQGKLRRYDSAGNATEIGSGFPFILLDAEFGPDGALYVADFPNDRILRIAPDDGPVIPEPGTLSLAMAGLGALWFLRRRLGFLPRRE